MFKIVFGLVREAYFSGLEIEGLTAHELRWR